MTVKLMDHPTDELTIPTCLDIVVRVQVPDRECGYQLSSELLMMIEDNVKTAVDCHILESVSSVGELQEPTEDNG